MAACTAATILSSPLDTAVTLSDSRQLAKSIRNSKAIPNLKTDSFTFKFLRFANDRILDFGVPNCATCKYDEA
jgi:hypothetical protein